jgi:glutamate/tyrosine decarboxylase-like PLP-dependent enzyme
MDIRALFSKAAEHAADFRQSIAVRPQLPAQKYAESLVSFSEPLPQSATDAETVIDDLVARAEPGLHLMTGPRFFGWVIGGSHPVGAAADMLVSAWGQNAGNHAATPAAAAAETVASAWLLELLGLPRQSSVGFVTGATIANFTCLAAARGAVLREVGWDPDVQGLFGAPPISVLIGDDAHTTVFSGLQFLGLGHDRVIRVPTDDQGRIVNSAFEEAIGKLDGPAIVILQAGQINTGAFDDFATLIPLAKEKGAWVHVDGAFGLWAQASSDRRHLSSGVELADSWATDGHKWLQTPYDCGYAIVRDEVAHRRAMTIAASYLPIAGEGERDPSHYVPELSRRARGFATWAIIKHLGSQGIAGIVERNCRAARLMADLLAQEPGIEVLNQVELNQVILRFGADLPADEADAMTAKVIAGTEKDGVIFAGGAKWRGQQVMRISVTNYQTDDDQAHTAVGAILHAYDTTRGDNRGQGS